MVSAASKLDLITLKMRCELERGRVYNSAGIPVHAESHFVAACEAAVEAEKTPAEDDDPSTGDALQTISYLKVDALHMLAIVAPSNALRTSYVNQGLTIAGKADKKRGRTHSWLGPLLNNLGWETLEAGDFKKAIDVLQEAANVRREDVDSIEGDRSKRKGKGNGGRPSLLGRSPFGPLVMHRYKLEGGRRISNLDRPVGTRGGWSFH